MLATWLTSPALLLTLLALPVGSAFMLFAYFRRRTLMARLGNSLLARKCVLVCQRRRRWKSLCILTSLSLLALASAGPRWGLDKSAQHRKGRDVILVLDLSRSMNAEQPSRRELAVRALRHLAETFEEHGGNRVALIAFASRPELLFPLTQDCDHLRHVLAQVDSADGPNLATEEPISGTRIGAALKLAVESCDPQRSNRPIIVLLSDGDDPANDDEWQQGVQAATDKKIRIHTVGIGDPDKDDTIPAGNDVLLYNGKPVRTRLQEKCLRDIAHATDGVYIPAHTQSLPLGSLVEHLLDADELRDEVPIDALLPVYQLRYTWFLCPAVLLLMLTLLLNEGPIAEREKGRKGEGKMAIKNLYSVVFLPFSRSPLLPFSHWAVGLLAILSVSAADPNADEFLRQGNDAYARTEYDQALKLYEKAETLSLDPGLISFNKAAVYYRLKQHKEAIECYRRSLQDDQASAERRARAHFDLGNALLHFAGDNPRTLAEAIGEYRACLGQPNLETNLRTDAHHNLELAQLLWLRVRETLPDDKKVESEKPKYPDPNEKKDEEYVYQEVKATKEDKQEKADNVPNTRIAKTLRSETIQVLPDEDKVHPFSPELTLATVEGEARRIAEARRGQRNPKGPATLSTKDW